MSNYAWQTTGTTADKTREIWYDVRLMHELYIYANIWSRNGLCPAQPSSWKVDIYKVAFQRVNFTGFWPGNLKLQNFIFFWPFSWATFRRSISLYRPAFCHLPQTHSLSLSLWTMSSFRVFLQKLTCALFMLITSEGYQYVRYGQRQ